MNISTFLKVLIGVVATILIGAIGSGVWEKLLSPFLDYSYRFVVDLIDGFSSDYKNTVYKRAALGFHETYSLRVMSVFTVLFMALLFIFPTFFTMRSSSQYKQSSEPFRRKVKLIMLIFAIASSVGMSFIMQQHHIANSTITHVIRSSDILRPYIGETDYRKLLSDFYQIKTAEEFYLLNQKIVELGKKHNVKLTEINPL